MKKLIVVAAIAVSALISNASQVEWAYSQMTEDGVGVDLANYKAYLFTESVWESVASQVKDNKLAKDAFVGWSDGQVVPGVEPDSGYTTYGFESRYATGTSGNYVLVMADEDTGVIVYDSIAMTAFENPQDQHVAGTWTFWPGDEPSSVTYGWASDVPEPTSGLLLLLGVAGLALRRRRA